MQFNSLVDAYLHHAKQTPNNVAFRYFSQHLKEEIILTYVELIDQSKRFANKLSQIAKAGDRVLIPSPTHEAFMPSVIACWMLDLTPVPSYPPKNESDRTELKRLAHIIQSASPSIILGPAETLTQLQPITGGSTCLSYEQLALSPIATNNFSATAATSPSPALLLYTSGSTGSPKGVPITHEMLVSNYSQFIIQQNITQKDKTVVWLPNCHIAGFYMRSILSLVGGETIVYQAADFIMKPLTWLQLISDHKATLSAAPNFAYELIAASSISEELDLSSWRMAISGGEVISSNTVARFLSALEKLKLPQHCFTPYYGMTETLCTSVQDSEHPPKLAQLSREKLLENIVELHEEVSEDSIAFLSNGKLLGGTKLQIVNPNTEEPTLDGHIGEITLQGDSITSGYWNLSHSDTQTSDGYFRTGDLGFMMDGELFITGRLKELIIVRGKNYYPQDIEQSLLSEYMEHAIAALAAYEVDDNGRAALGISVQIDEQSELATSQQIEQGIVQLISSAFGIRPLVKIWQYSQMPRTSSGKIKRAACAKNHQDDLSLIDRHDAAAPEALTNLAPHQDTLETLKQHIAELLALPAEVLGDHHAINSLGLDSVQLVQLASKLSQSLEHQSAIDLSIFYQDISIEDLATLLDCPPSNGAHKLEYTEELAKLSRLCASYQKAELAKFGKGIFITGATGFLGSYLLRDLLQNTEQQIYCLVRASDPTAGMQRIIQSLSQITEWETQKHHWSDRIQVLCGSLDAPYFGLNAETFSSLTEQISSIYHNGANVNFVAPYSQLYQVNVASNHTIIELALAAGNIPIHYVSTVAVFNSPDRDQFPTIREEDFLPSPDRIFSGYAKTKWVSEKIYQHAESLGMQVAVYRPALVMGDSQTGFCHTDDFLCRFIKGCIDLGHFPKLDLHIDMTPVDYVSQQIIDLSLDRRSIGQQFHILNDNPITLPDLVDWLTRQGHSLELMDSDQWHQKLSSELPTWNALYPVYPFLLEQIPCSEEHSETILPFFTKRGLNLDSRKRKANAPHGTSCPPVDHQLLNRYFEYFQDINFISNPNQKSKA
ncbi:thioester reductase domain-containing protein [Rubritalea marina]|uniref:thioester reductase domain-containing protein n=1 Tax=Rubritalea marina TaxID=361055 RepID=UPI000364A1E7|nr:thioester reductase domain-containing protein [Rubritalea marina]